MGEPEIGAAARWCVVHHGVYHDCEWTRLDPITPEDEAILRRWVVWNLGPHENPEPPEHPTHLRASPGLYASLLLALDAERARTVVLAEWVQGMRAAIARTDDGNATRWKMLGFIDDLLFRLAVLPVDRVEIRNGHGAARVERIVIAHAETVLGEPVKAIGSVEGTLESVTVRGGREFSVYDPLTQRRIECTFGHRIPVSAIGAAVERRVRVFGEIRYRPTGEIVSVRADEIEVQPPPDQLPTADEVRGILS